MVLLRPKIIFGHRRVIWIKNASPRPYDVWARSFIVGAWEVIWAIWSQAQQRMEMGWGVQSLERKEKNYSIVLERFGFVKDLYGSSADDQSLSGSESLWVWFQPQVW